MAAVLVLTTLALACGLLLVAAERRLRVDSDPLTDHINALLPQTQCGQCGYPGCRPYAAAIASGEADINQCPPGGESTVVALAELLGRTPRPVGAEFGQQKPPQVALIDEDTCIGCALCIQACPVDAIIGASRQMHTVIRARCTGCELCLAPCPMDCIELVPTREFEADGWISRGRRVGEAHPC